MTAENVEIVRRLMEAYFSGDFAAVLEIQSVVIDPEIEFRPPPEHPDFDVFRGIEELNRAFAVWTGEWKSLRFDTPEYIDAGDRVLVAHRQWGTAKGSGIEVETEVFNVFTLSAGKIIRFNMFFERAGALEAAGLVADRDSSI
jgi:ketosteroid isomerase-like protein